MPKIHNTSIPFSRHSSSALSAEQLTVWNASSQAALSNGAALENSEESWVSICIVLMSIG